MFCYCCCCDTTGQLALWRFAECVDVLACRVSCPARCIGGQKRIERFGHFVTAYVHKVKGGREDARLPLFLRFHMFLSLLFLMY